MSKLTRIIIRAIAPIMILSAFSSASLAAEFNLRTVFKILSSQLAVYEQKSLDFGVAVLGQMQTLVRAPSDSGAAVFSAVGVPNAKVTVSVVENSITLITGAGDINDKQITVTKFTTGGDLDSRGRATFDGQGQLSDMRIGAQAKIKTSNIGGHYQGSATFRIVYN